MYNKKEKASANEVKDLKKKIYHLVKELSKRIEKFAGQLFIIIVTHGKRREVFMGTISSNAKELVNKNRFVNLGVLRNDYELPTACGWLSINDHPFDILKEPLYLHMPRLLPNEKAPGRLRWHIRDIFFTQAEFSAEAISYFKMKKGPDVQIILGDFKCKSFLKKSKDTTLVAKINDLLKKP